MAAEVRGSVTGTDAPPSDVQGAPAVGGVELRALGPVEAIVDGRLVDLGPRKQRALLALLVSQVDRPVAVDVLLGVLWSVDPPAVAMTSLRSYVANLRRLLEPHRAPRAPAAVLRTRAPGYLLDSRGVDVDVHRFSGHATTGWEAWGRGDLQRALSEFEAGLALWRGQAYAEIADATWATWVVPEAARLEELRLSVVEGRCAALIELGAHEVVVAELEAHMQAHPLREHGWELLALALYRAGRQADALAVLRDIRTRLAAELGIDPSAALQRLERDILTQEPSLDWYPPTSPRTVAAAVSVAPQQVSPTGLVPVEEEDISIGRNAALRRLVDPSAAGGREEPFLVATGPATGKSGRLLGVEGEQEARREMGVHPPLAVDAVAEIADCFGVSVGDVLKAAGISKRTFQSWKVSGVRRPPQSSEGRLWLLHQLAQDLVEVKGRAGLRQWLEADPSRRRLLRAGKIDELAEHAYRTVDSQHVPWRDAGDSEQRYLDQPGGGLTLEMDPGDVVEPES